MKGFFKFGSPFIKLHFEGKEIDFLLDTGFNGYLVIPKSISKNFQLEKIGMSDYVTASGDGKLADVYLGKLNFFNEEMKVPVLIINSNFALIGMEMFDNCKIIIEKSKQFVEVIK